MKKVTLLLLFVVTSLLSCKKDEAERNTDKLIGKWTVESVAEVNYENGVEKKRQQINAQNQTNICDFRNNGTATLNLDGGEVEVKWVAVDNRLQVTPERGSDVYFNIKSLTRNELVLELEDDVDVENGITYRETLEWKMRK
ncbi:MAG: hypothetical protein EOO42_08630 [Flavobacteriales bacterium]|nr:MAG: hypothetical protein EOO42_08630 [Flavobacteriales bacterium]